MSPFHDFVVLAACLGSAHAFREPVQYGSEAYAPTSGAVGVPDGYASGLRHFLTHRRQDLLASGHGVSSQQEVLALAEPAATPSDRATGANGPVASAVSPMEVSSQDTSSGLAVAPVAGFSRRVLVPALSVPAISLLPIFLFVLYAFIMPSTDRPLAIERRQEGTLRPTSQANGTANCSDQVAVQRAPLTPPNVLVFATMVAAFLMHANLTVAMPTSERAVAGATSTASTVDLAQSVSRSGYVLGAYGIGAMTGLPVFFFGTRRSILSCFMLQCSCLIVGNSLYCYAVMSTQEGTQGQWWSITPGHAQIYLFIGRAVAGIEAGANYTCYMALTIFTSYEVRAKYFGLLNVGAGLGLVCGPALASLSQDLSLGFHPEVAGTLILLALGLFFLIFLCVAFPRQEELFALKDIDTLEAYAEIRGKSAATTLGDRCSEKSSWRALLTGLTITFSRIYLRIAWESGAAVVITIGIFGNSRDGIKYSGYLLAVPSLLFVPGQLLLNRYFLHSCSTETLSRSALSLELLGMVAMFSYFDAVRQALGLVGSLGVFLIGSAAFYTGNQFNASIFNTWMTKFCVPGHPVLNKEGSVGLTIFAITCGYVFGPLVVRVVLSGAYSQDDFATFLLVGVLMQGAIAEVGVRWTERTDACA